MQVITGTAKGIPLKVPHKARPISDRAKASLFDMIGPDILGKTILDLFAGSGALGIEALSRGAEHATFIDIDKYAVKDLEANLERTKLTEKAEVRHQKAMQFVGSEPDEGFDIVFADPPYVYYKEGRGDTRFAALLGELERIIPPGGAIVLKHPKELKAQDLPPLKLADSRKYGPNRVSLWVKV